MGSYYGALLSIIRNLYTDKELTKYPDYNWLIFNIVSFMMPSKTFPTVIPLPFDDTLWSNLFWIYYDSMAYKTGQYGIMDTLNNFKSPKNSDMAQNIFDFIPLSFQGKFFKYAVTKLKYKNEPTLYNNATDESHTDKIFEENVVRTV
tara:strand:- start:182 stop:622 length:441 start_codon:yes stop_codon:yes gene_type:complete